MDFIYFLVTSSKDWTNTFHENFFNANFGFAMGVIGAVIIGIVLSIAFYFGCCNSSKSCKSATIGVWSVFLILASVIAYFYADLIVIGDASTKDDKSVFRAYSFYKANEDYYINQTDERNRGNGGNDTFKTDLNQKKEEIKSNLNKGKDVRFEYDLTTAVLTAFIFFIASLVFKRFTINGKTIPCKKP